MSERERLEQTIVALEAQRAILGDAAADAAIASLRRELSALDAAEARPSHRTEGERRVVTVLFSDVVGSTALAESMDPELWTEIMNAIFERLIEPVERYGGTVARLMGDAILAFFGAPTAHEDDPQRAVLAGLAILENIQPFREKLQEEEGLDFNVRVGINTGLVIVGEVGSETAAEYTAMGDAVNLAARMEHTAQPGTVQVSEDTYRLVTPLFEFEPLGGIKVKGKAEPVPSYRLLGRKVAPGRIRGIEGLAAPLIGREAELERLMVAVGDLERGVGRIVTLIGEAGLGKSRLLREMQQTIFPKTGNGVEHNENAPLPAWYQTQSLSYESEQPYALFQRLIRHMAGATQSDSTKHLRKKIGTLLGVFPPGEQEDVRTVFESLFGLASQTGQAPMVGEAFKGRLFTVMQALFRKRAGQRPTILVCDDLHWSDAASVALLRHLFRLTERLPLLILCAMRPDSHSEGWELKRAAESNFGQGYAELRLQALSLHDSNQLVESLLTISDLPAPLRARILDKTEGNPFFVEEVVRTLIESGAVVRDASGSRWLAKGRGEDIEIPGNVQSLLTARIDRLEEDARSTLQLAAVVGRSFYYRVLVRIVDTIADLENHLLNLSRAQLIQEAARHPELEYIFRHALTQEAAYSTILLRQRRTYHHRVGESLEALFPDKREELAGTLARHFFLARDYQPALGYYTMAGDVAFRLFAHAEAGDFYSQAIACSEKVTSTSSDQLIHLYSRRGRAYELANKFDDALDNYLQMADLAHEREDEALLLSSLIAQCILHAVPPGASNPSLARELGLTALNLAKKRNDRAAEARTHWGLMLVEFHAGGDQQKILAYGQKALDMARELGLEELMAYTLSNLAYTYMTQEQFEAAREANREARSLWQSLGNLPMLADSFTIRMGINRFSGEINALVEQGDEALRLSQSIGNLWHENQAYGLLGYAHALQGRLGQAVANTERGITIAEQMGIPLVIQGTKWSLLFVYLIGGALEQAEKIADELYALRNDLGPVFGTLFLASVAQVKIARGKLDESATMLERAFKAFTEAESFPFARAPLFVADSHLQLAVGKPEKALDRLEELLQRLRYTGSRFYLAEALWLKGVVLRSLNRPEEAHQTLLAARSAAEKTAERPVQWRILVALVEIEELRGNAAEAAVLHAQAREIVAYIADHTGSEELRATYLSLPEVQSVLAT
jgi:class 3 adenylate cyclase/tetratricopeptide (TPR) repeat protein